MTGCNDSNTALGVTELDAPVGNLVPAVVNLLQRVSAIEPTIASEQATEVQVTSALTFPDGIGEGKLVADLFIYRDEIRLDLHIDHNRVFATAEGGPSDRRCYLNDYVASVTLDSQEEQLSSDFVRKVVAGVAAARDAVRRHNRRSQAPWNEIRVAVGETATA